MKRMLRDNKDSLNRQQKEALLYAKDKVTKAQTIPLACMPSYCLCIGFPGRLLECPCGFLGRNGRY